MMKELLTEIYKESFDPSADGGLVYMEDTGNLGERLAIKIIGGEQEAIFGGELMKSTGNCAGELIEFCWDWRWFCLGRRSVESIEWRFAMRSAVMIDMALGKGGAKPAEERATAGIRGERRPAFSIDLT
jgi:hypothetical protein